MPRSRNHDVRMTGFSRRSTVDEAWAWLDGLVHPLPAETVSLAEAAGRVLASGVASAVDVPGFDRAMMDGLAVRSADTQGAGAYQPLPLKIVGVALPGRPYAGPPLGPPLGPAEAVRIMTGAPLPTGADAVLPAEWVEWGGRGHGSGVGGQGEESDRTFALSEVSPGKHIGLRGEDVVAGTVVLEAGRRLRPQDVGVLSSVGESSVPVVRRPIVRLVITGNELLPAGTRPHGCHIADANGPMLAALVSRDGGIVDHPGLIPDDRDAIARALSAEDSDHRPDVILVSGGSSVGEEDHVPLLLAELGELAIHGIAMRPSSPTGMGRLGDTLVFLLPGNPVSCLCAYDFFAGRAIRVLGGRPREWPYRRIVAPLSRKIASTIGRVDYARVRLIADPANPAGPPQLDPVAISGASVLTSTTRADGFVIVPQDSEGYPPGTEVEAWLYDPDGAPTG